MATYSGAGLSLVDLETDMHGRDTLVGFDVLVSYNENDLNAMLAERASEITEVLSMPTFEVTTDDGFGDVEKFQVTFTFQIPTFSFVGVAGSSTCSLNFPVSGSILKEASGETKQVPAGLLMLFQAPLATVQGSVTTNSNSSTFQPIAGAVAQPLGNMITLSESGTDAHGVCVDLTDLAHTAIIFAPAPGVTPDPDMLKFLNSSNILTSSIINYFKQAVGLRYYLTAVSNGLSPSSSQSNTLQPTTFCFTIAVGDPVAKQDPSLCTWVGVVGGAGNYPNQAPSSFRPFLYDRNPVPLDRTASIIFSHNLILNSFFKPGLQNMGSTNVRSQDPGQPGMLIKFNMPSHPVHIEGQHEDYTDSFGQEIQHLMDDVDFNLSDGDTTLSISSGVATSDQPSGQVSWTTPTRQYSWTNMISGVDDGDPPSYYQSGSSGTVDLTFSLAVTGQWSKGTDVKKPNSLDFNIAWPSQLQTSEQVSNDQNWFSSLTTGAGGISPYFNVAVTLPQWPQAVMDVDYFLTTNLFYPGKCLFNMDPPISSDGETTKGLACPRDVILTGQVATPSTHSRLAKQVSYFLPQSHSKKLSVMTARQFVQDLVSASDSNLPGSLFNAFTSPDYLEETRNVMSQFGFSDLSDAEYAEILSTPVSNIWTSNQLPALQASITLNGQHDTDLASYKKSRPSLRQDASATFDIRVYAGIYNVEMPAEDAAAKKQLIVDGTTGKISYDDVQVAPTATTDQQEITEVTWATPIGSYAVVFSCTRDSSSGTFLAHFAGNRTIQGNAPETFSGTQTAPPQKSVDDAWTDASNASTVIGIFGFLFTIVTTGWAIKKTLNGEKEAEKSAAKMHDENMQLKDQIDLGWKSMAEATARQVLDRHQINWASFQGQLTNSVNGSVSGILNNMTLEDLERLDVNDMSAPEWVDLRNAAKSAAENSTELFGQGAGVPVIADRFASWFKAGFITTAQAQKISQDALQPQIQDKVSAIADTAPVGGQPFFLDLVRVKVIDVRREKRQLRIDDLSKTIGKAIAKSFTTAAEIRTLQKQFDQNEKEIADKNTPEERKEQLAKENAELQQEIEDKTRTKDEADQEKANAEQEQAQNDNAQDEDSNAQDQSESEVESRSHEIFTG